MVRDTVQSFKQDNNACASFFSLAYSDECMGSVHSIQPANIKHSFKLSSYIEAHCEGDERYDADKQIICLFHR